MINLSFQSSQLPKAPSRTHATPFWQIFLLLNTFLGFVFSAEAQLRVLTPSDPAISLVSNSSYTVTWARGGTTFNRVRIKLSVDGGLTFPYLLVNNTPSTSTDSSQAVVIPGIITNQARIRITNQNDSLVGDVSDNDFAITGYCFPWNTVCTNNYIRNFRLNTINNTSTCGARAYTNYTASGTRTTSLYRGPNYPFTLKTSKINTDYGVGIWCDLNSDSDFDDAGEFLYSSASLDTSFSGTISIPVGTSTGAKRLRIRAVRGQLLTAGQACTWFPNVTGEIEDYTVTIGAQLTGGPLRVVYPSASAISLASNGTATATALWSKGGTIYDKVQIKLSVDGGETFPYLLVNNTNSLPTDTSEGFVIPGLPTTQARIRIANQLDSTDGAISENDFSITGYCWPWGMSCTNNYIRSFKINTLNNTTTCATRAYINNTPSGTRTTSLYRGPSYPFTIKTSKVNINYGVGIWCDLNGDSDFDDAGEFLYGSSTLDTTFSGAITIPVSVSAGTKRMRVRAVRGSLLTAVDYCTNFSAGGETEDYTITVGAVLTGGPLIVRYPNNTGISLASTGAATANAIWSKGGTTYDRVQIKLSTDGGATFPYLLVNNTPNIPTDTTEPFVIPGLPTTQARIRIANQADSTDGAISENDFAITGYCWPWNTVCTNNYISSFSVNTLLNNTNNCSTRGYNLRTTSGANTTTLYKGSSYSFTIKTSKTNPNMGVAIWCDLNNDVDFDDAGELLYAGSTLDTSFTGSVSIPVSASEGLRRLRVRTVHGQLLSAGNACTNFPAGGEIEDYTITVGPQLLGGPLVVRYPSNAGISLVSNATATARWSKGGTTFNNVRIKLSVDGGQTFPYLLVNNTPSTPTDTSENFVVPGIITNQARIRIANQNDSTQGDISDNDFSITGYCWPWNTVCTGGYISNVTLNTSLNNTSVCSPRGYIVYTAAAGRTTTMQRGLTYPFSVTTNTSLALGIWCDFNEDQDFDDPGEFLYASPSFGTSFSGNIEIPQAISTGTKRLRVRAVTGRLLTSADACTYIPGDGEIEGYSISINQPTITISGSVGTQCAGSNISVAFNTTGTFLPGNFFQVQLSGPGGSFSSGVSVIGQGTTSPIPCYIRLATVPGSYRIRIMSATPLPATFGTPSGTFTIRAKPSDLVATSAERCGPGTLTLTTSGCTTTRWYDAADQGNQVGTGNSFTTPVLTESKTYYVTCLNAQGCQGNRTPVYATVKPFPTISDVSPLSGVVDFDLITISGSGFSGLDSVRFSPGKKGFITTNNATTITVKAPGGTTSGPITVYNKCGGTTSSQIFTPVVPVISDPVITLTGGTYPSATSTTITCATAGAEIYYTLDGSTPVVGNAVTKKYSGAIFIGKSLTIRAIGFRSGWTTSGLVSATYTITTFTRAATPVITPPTGSYVGGQYVTMTCATPGATIYYTTNGQTPQPGVNNPVKYSGPFTRIDPQVFLKAVAVADGYENSLVGVSNLTISGGTALSAPSFSPTPGTYGSAQTVTITNPDPIASIYYTLDGTDPFIYNPLAQLYTGPLLIASSKTLKAQAFRPGFGDSPRTTGVYTIGAFRQVPDGQYGGRIYFTEEAEDLSQNQSDWLKKINHGHDANIEVFPNPTHGMVWVNFGQELSNAQISVCNMLGQEIQRLSLEGAQPGTEVNLANQPAGFYLIRVKTNQGQIAEKRVVVR